MCKISVDYSDPIGPVKPMHSVGQPPMVGLDTQYFRYLKEANIPYSRLHDVGGWFGGNMFVDIPNIFRDFEADAEKEESYDFAFTDILIKGLMDNGCEPYFRLGITIENYHYIKAYRSFPPSDFVKWSRICEHIVRHYYEGWANGYHYNIRYWEIWNEPDGHYKREENAMWKGTPEEYFELYRITATHLKACFGDSIKVGGYASCGFYAALSEQTVSGEAFGMDRPISDWEDRTMGFIRFFNSFLDFVAREKPPLDFFSHHSYASVSDTRKMQLYCESLLASHGLSDVEIHLNEWNTDPSYEFIGSSRACADATAMMIAMHSTKLRIMCFYDARMKASAYGGMFNAYTQKPFCIYYGFKAFGRLYALGTQVRTSSDNPDIYVLAARGADGSRGMLIVNLGDDCTVSFKGDVSGMKTYLIDAEHTESEIPFDGSELEIGRYQVMLLA